MAEFERSPDCYLNCQKAQFVVDQLVEKAGLRGLEAARALPRNCTDTCAALMIDQTIATVNQLFGRTNRGDSSGVDTAN